MKIKNVCESIIKYFKGVASPTSKLKKSDLSSALLEDVRLHPTSTDKERAKRLGSNQSSIFRLRKKLNIHAHKKDMDLQSSLLEDVRLHPISTDKERAKRLGCNPVYICILRKKLNISRGENNLKALLLEDVALHPISTDGERAKRLGSTDNYICRLRKKLNIQSQTLQRSPFLRNTLKKGDLKAALLEDVRLHPISKDIERARRLGCSDGHICTLRKKLNIPQQTKNRNINEY